MTTRYSSTMSEILHSIRMKEITEEAKLKEEPASPDEGSMAEQQLEFMMHAVERTKMHIQSGGDFPEWMQNKLSGAHEKLKGLYANIEHGDVNEELDLDEMKMDDPKLIKAFDKLKKGQTIKLKTSSTISKGKDFVEYIVKSKNIVNKGRVEKVTLVTKGNEKSVKKFLYKRDGKVTFAIGDMGASIDDIKEGVEPIQWPSQPLEEKLKVSDGLGAWIDDFKKSDAPQFQGKSDEEKKNMAIAAFTDAGGKLDEEKEFKPHMMYDPKTGKGYKADTHADHVKMDKMGYTHEKPEVKEEDEPKKEPEKSDGAKAVDQMRDDKQKTRIAQLQLQIAKAQETINKINAQEK